ncbi:DUF202 domain-containing protein [Jatrophihabitans cynanchi]|uniref:DUF202 domain-containing protein n=1 Tax=Jatrophihabitans cynanchi TaxID=2944128 RepID=A0ABY7JT20_9ACTN|nr:DUF202 domain-containing protein [Jatrophihabitans sp. SB3-54]WAX55175.1 DUF202 domain-containing protein [Jatrophihabitans sp. SB3-54]
MKWPSLRRPQWLDDGIRPDYRFSLANERTFLAWIRTSIALLAAAFAVVHFVDHPGVGAIVIGVVLAVGGTLTALEGYLHWSRNEQAMRADAPLPWTGLPRLIAFGIVGVGVITLVLALLR